MRQRLAEKKRPSGDGVGGEDRVRDLEAGCAAVVNRRAAAECGVPAMTVHIIEDDPGVGDSLAMLLGQIGHSARVYPDAESFFEAPPPASGDTVIVDLGLPGLSGVQLIRWINGLKLPPKVIAITGQSNRNIMEMLGDEQPAVLLRKPLTEELLVSHL
jgi:FixJ family two-component response regulator